MYVAAPPPYHELVTKLSKKGNRLVELIQSPLPEDGRGYIHWDKLRQLDPPNGLTTEEWWFTVKWGRQNSLRNLPLTDVMERHFQYSQPDPVLRLLRHVDQRCSGEIVMPEVVTADDQARQRYLVNSLMEEAIRSSQLEGATTSRKVAKELLRSGREPKDRSERMILNNYRALIFMREVESTLDAATVLELQRILTDGTLEDPSAAGRLQTPEDDRVAVYDRDTGELLHKPPPAEELPARLEALCEFANESDDAEPFIHPAVRAILLHFWLAYDHPFEDGNGRTARALFYWYMRTRGYWLIEYLTVSRILANAPAKYAKAFLQTETDERDTTYFVLYQLEVIERAVEELHHYLDRKAKEVRDVEQLIKAGASEFNYRQLALLGHAIRHPDQVYTFQTHAASHTVTHETARNDLLLLVEKGLLERNRAGRRHTFTPSPRLVERLKQKRAPTPS